MNQEDFEEEALFDAMGAHQEALQAAVGYFVTLNVPTSNLYAIAACSANDQLRFAARIVLHSRGVEWRTQVRP